MCVVLTVHLGKPKEVVGDGGGAALDLHKWDLIFSCQQDVVLVVEDGCQVNAPNEEEMNRLFWFCAASTDYFYFSIYDIGTHTHINIYTHTYIHICC